MTILPEDRYDQNVRKRPISSEILVQAIELSGFSSKNAKIQELSGGFQNSNYLIESGLEKFVLRFYSQDPQAAAREFGVLQLLNKRRIKSPRVFELLEFKDIQAIALEYVDGLLMQDLLAQSPSTHLPLFGSIGTELARIHQIQFSSSGFLGAQAQISHDFQNFGSFLKDYLQRVLPTLSEDRISWKECETVLQLIEKHWQIVLATEPRHCLVHCDFNPKNILVTKSKTPTIASVLDWEFSLSGNGYCDFGNFFRFSDDYLPGSQEAFIDGYESVAGPVHTNWREVSLLLDLGNMCSFLERPENYQKTFKTARSIFHKTIQHFQKWPKP